MTQINGGLALVVASLVLLAVLGELSLLLILVPASAVLGYLLLRLQRNSAGRLHGIQ